MPFDSSNLGKQLSLRHDETFAPSKTNSVLFKNNLGLMMKFVGLVLKFPITPEMLVPRPLAVPTTPPTWTGEEPSSDGSSTSASDGSSSGGSSSGTSSDSSGGSSSGSGSDSGSASSGGGSSDSGSNSVFIPSESSSSSSSSSSGSSTSGSSTNTSDSSGGSGSGSSGSSGPDCNLCDDVMRAITADGACITSTDCGEEPPCPATNEYEGELRTLCACFTVYYGGCYNGGCQPGGSGICSSGGSSIVVQHMMCCYSGGYVEPINSAYPGIIMPSQAAAWCNAQGRCFKDCRGESHC